MKREPPLATFTIDVPNVPSQKLERLNRALQLFAPSGTRLRLKLGREVALDVTRHGNDWIHSDGTLHAKRR